MRKGIGPQGLGAAKSPAKKTSSVGAAFSGTKSKLMREPEGRLRRMATRGDKESMDKLDARDKVKFIAKNQASGRAQSYKAREDNFGVKKPKANIK